MQVEIRSIDPLTVEADAMVVFVFSSDSGVQWSPAASSVDSHVSGELAVLARDARFTGRAASTLVIPTLGRLPARRVILAGVGPQADFDEAVILRAVGAAARSARDNGARKIAVALPEGIGELTSVTIAEAALIGARLGLYRFDAYRGKGSPDRENQPDITLLTLLAFETSDDAAQAAIRRADAIASAVNLARDLVNEPASTLTPEHFAQRARNVAAAANLQIEVLGEDELEALGARAILAVGAGSVNPPRLIRLRYQPEGEPEHAKVTGLVGKAITFDTGGYSIKPYEGMLEMKGDMAGGAAVLGAMSALSALNCPVPVLATICVAENMISGTAFRPGDVIEGMNGVTVEILSTDAEGRLVLADGLVDTARRGATEMIDLATLTGAAVVALGEGTTALFASDDELAEKLLGAAAHAGERMWRMPLIAELESKIKGDIADIKNTGGRGGGAITAALFLQHFSEGLPWAHLDIAGASRQEKAGPIGPKGATGVGVRTLLRYLTA